MFSIEKATLADCPLIQTLASNIWEPTYGSILPANNSTICSR